MNLKVFLIGALAGSLLSVLARGQEPEPILPTLPETVVEGEPLAILPADPGDVYAPATAARRGENLLGEAGSASQGVFGQPDIQNRPFSRPAEVLELIPGLVATQHSGSGKANQYFLRGFNLDHGTDFALRVDGVPINLPTHAHGQGYLDINWLIPELIQSVEYKKGPYYADFGDFNGAGAADMFLARTVPQGGITITTGYFNYQRALLADSWDSLGGKLMIAYENVIYDGPWVVPENFTKFNGIVTQSWGDDVEGTSLSLLAYRAYWTATNQIPQQSVDQGFVDRFGSLDPSDGGLTTRVTLNAQYWNRTDTTLTRANAFAYYYDLDLFSNFTFFLDDPVNGDQIEQRDRRVVSGLNLSHRWEGSEFTTHTVGAQFRNDNIFAVGLNHTSQRQLIDQVRNDNVNQQSYSLYYQNQTQWTSLFRSMVGLRGDQYHFDSQSTLDPAQAGDRGAGIFSPKLGLIAGPWNDTELYFNWGLGFHSNDARGVNDPLAPASPLVRSNGSEIGLRSQVTPEWQTTLALWYLELDSELLFVGDAGTTEPSGASHRFGVETSNYYRVSNTTFLDVDYAWVRPRFENDQRIPNAVENVLTTGFTWRPEDLGLYTTLRLRFFGPAALIEDNSVRSPTTTLLSGQVGYQAENWRLTLDLFNLLNAKQNDITYFYTSSPPVLGPGDYVHFHPVEPFAIRGSFTMRW